MRLSVIKRSMKKAILKMTGRVTGWLGIVLLVGWLAVGCQTQGDKGKFSATGSISSTTNATQVPALGPESVGPFAPDIERFAIGDLIHVTFSGITDPIQPHEERIKDDGTITLPLIGAIKAGGKTPGELQKAITEGS